MNKFLVFLEQREGIVKQASINAWNRVQELAVLQANSVVTGILVGPADTRQLDGRMAGYGVIYHAGDTSSPRPERDQLSTLSHRNDTVLAQVFPMAGRQVLCAEPQDHAHHHRRTFLKRDTRR